MSDKKVNRQVEGRQATMAEDGLLTEIACSKRNFKLVTLPLIGVLFLLAIASIVAIGNFQNLASARKEKISELTARHEKERNADRIEFAKQLVEVRALSEEQLRVVNEAPSEKVARYIMARYSRLPSTLVRTIAAGIVRSSSTQNVSLALLMGMIETESQYNPMSKSKANARGLMQVRYSVWKESLSLKNERQLHDIDDGILAGIFVYKKYLKDEKGDIRKALWKYNGKAADKSKYADKVYLNAGRFAIFYSKNDPKLTAETDKLSASLKARWAWSVAATAE